MSTHLRFICILALAVFSCGKTGETKEDKKSDRDAVLGIHDEIMPRMDDLYALKKKLNEKIKNAPDLVQEKREALEARIRSLDSASRAMMVWMRQFDPSPDSLDSAALKTYYGEQMKQISDVKTLMLDAIDGAEEALK